MCLIVVASLMVLTVHAKSAPQTKEQPNPDAELLKLLVSVEQPSITLPLSVRITLHLHNAGRDPLWIYRPVRNGAEEGSRLEVKLEPAGSLPSQDISNPAQGVALESAGLPHPKLVRLGPGEDHEEKAVIRLTPVMLKTDSAEKPIWGHYRLLVIFQAKYSNAEEITRNVGSEVWQGAATSNTIDLELLAPPATPQGSVAGSVTDPDGHAVRDAVVSLSNQQERLVDQVTTESTGRFSFTRLPIGFYWVTARLAKATEDTVVFRHVELTPAEPAGAIELVMLPKENYEATGWLHKPVLFRVTDPAGAPRSQVTLEVTWSNGSVLDNLKGQASDDGTVALELIPGRNFVTLRRRNCPKQEERVDVTGGPGIEGFKLSLDCSRK